MASWTLESAMTGPARTGELNPNRFYLDRNNHLHGISISLIGTGTRFGS
jgi:hypothetical protein